MCTWKNRKLLKEKALAAQAGTSAKKQKEKDDFLKTMQTANSR